MRTARVVLLVAVLVVPTVLSGCVARVETAKEWLDGKGALVVRMGALPAGASGQSIANFSSVRIAVESVVAYPVGEIVPHAGVVYNPRLGVDLRKRFDLEEMLPILERTGIDAKTISKVDVKIMFVEAKDNDGNNVPLCPTDRPSDVKPCIALEKTGIYTLNKQADPPRMKRGKTMVMDFPLAVVYAPDVNEYFLQARFADEEAAVTFR